MAGNAVSDAIAQLTPEFDKIAAEYTAAIAKLPLEITDRALVDAGLDALVAYGQARQHAANLNRYSGWLAGTVGLPRHTGKHDPVLRILRPESITELSKLDEAHARPCDAALKALDPVLVTAVRQGVAFGLNTTKGSADLRTRLEAIRPSQLHGVALTH